MDAVSAREEGVGSEYWVGQGRAGQGRAGQDGFLRLFRWLVGWIEPGGSGVR